MLFYLQINKNCTKCRKSDDLSIVYTISTKMKTEKVLCKNHKKTRKNWQKRTNEVEPVEKTGTIF